MLDLRLGTSGGGANAGITFYDAWRMKEKKSYTPGSTNIAGWKMDPDGRCSSYWKMMIFQPAMLVYPRVAWLSSAFFGGIQFDG